MCWYRRLVSIGGSRWWLIGRFSHQGQPGCRGSLTIATMVYWSDLYTFSGPPEEAGMTPATDPPATDVRLLLLNPADNCLVACRALPAGETVLIDGEPVTLPRPVAMAHKL